MSKKQNTRWGTNYLDDPDQRELNRETIEEIFRRNQPAVPPRYMDDDDKPGLSSPIEEKGPYDEIDNDSRNRYTPQPGSTRLFGVGLESASGNAANMLKHMENMGLAAELEPRKHAGLRNRPPAGSENPVQSAFANPGANTPVDINAYLARLQTILDELKRTNSDR